ncbi:MAG: hypothetical protein VX733_10585 [Candidatus Latescibacterota bacterium]|nr:hypothetical protein [Candidatus Latescibacterota bacterium]
MRSIDLQDNLSKAPLAGREQGIQQSRPEHGQRQLAHELEQQHVLDHSRTKETAEPDPAANRTDQDGGQRRGQGARHPAHQAEDEEGEQMPQASPSATSRAIDVIA